MSMEWLALHFNIFGLVTLILGTIYMLYIYFKILGFNPIGALETLKHKRFKRTLLYTIFSFVLHIGAGIVFLLDKPEINEMLDMSFTIAYVSALVLLLRNIVHNTKKYIIFAKYKDDKFYSNKYKI